MAESHIRHGLEVSSDGSEDPVFEAKDAAGASIFKIEQDGTATLGGVVNGVHPGDLQVTGALDVDTNLNVDGNSVTDGTALVTGALTADGDVITPKDAPAALAMGNVTLAAAGKSFIELIGDAGATTINVISGGASGKILVLSFTDANITVAGAAIKLSGAFVSSALDTLTLIYNGTNWLELARGVNS
jgi:hypothetical protein